MSDPEARGAPLLGATAVLAYLGICKLLVHLFTARSSLVRSPSSPG
jgi:hypothetical protein